MSKFAGGMLMAVGQMLAWTTGLCSLAGGLFIVATLSNDPGLVQREGFQFLMLMALGGFALTVLGIWMFRRGRARVRERDE